MTLRLSDLVVRLENWGTWTHVRDNATRVPELERRIAALEKRLEQLTGNPSLLHREPLEYLND